MDNVENTNENETSQESKPQEVTRKEVSIDLFIKSAQHPDGKNYTGKALVSMEGPYYKVDLSGIEYDSDDFALWDHRRFEYVQNLLIWEARRQAGLEETCDLVQCDITGFYSPRENIVCMANGDYCFENLTIYFNGDYYCRADCSEECYRDEYGDIRYMWAPDYYWEDEMHWCEECECYVSSDDYDYDYDCCRYCAEERRDSIIEDYSESHGHEPILFGDYKDEDSFVGLGFELEVDCDSDTERKNGEVAEGLCSACGLDDDEMRYAHDGSLNHGFECISQPHTIKAFWDKADSWKQMLGYLARNGYKSHDAGTCGLHVHVSRGMFGRTETEQERAITKVYAFFDDNWDDLVKVSRRTDFNYCDKNSKETFSEETNENVGAFKKWRGHVKRNGGHYVALNNRNSATFEYRLGRGTLNAWSFFSWVDLVITITKNARRISIDKVETNDKISWLGGIKESTAKYIYKRGAFRKEMLTLYPNIEWETDLTENA